MAAPSTTLDTVIAGLTGVAGDVSAGGVSAGAGKLYLSPYVASGADATSLTFIGATQGGVEFDFKRSQKLVESDQYLGSINAFPIKEEFSVKFTVLESTLEAIKNAFLWNGTLTDGTRAGTNAYGSLVLGEESTQQFRQLVWKGLAPYGYAGSRYIQLWKVTFKSAAALKYEKGKEISYQITLDALTDPSAVWASKPAVGQILDNPT